MKAVLKRCVRWIARSPLPGAGVALLTLRPDRRPNLLRILTYHRIAPAGERPELDPGLISADPGQFAAQLDLLAEGCRFVSLAEVLAAFRGEHVLPPASVLVTFDDACRDFAEHAWPALRERGVPVALFVPTAFPDAPGKAFWWDRLYHAIRSAPHDSVLQLPSGPYRLDGESSRSACYRLLKELVKSLPHEQAMETVDRITGQVQATPVSNPVLGWEELRRLHREGVALAPHTRTHPLLNRLNAERIAEEVGGSLDDLEREIGPVPRVLAYPAGGENALVRQAVQAAGYELALSTRRGLNDLAACEPLALRRINVGSGATPALLQAQLLPELRLINRWLR